MTLTVASEDGTLVLTKRLQGAQLAWVLEMRGAEMTPRSRKAIVMSMVLPLNGLLPVCHWVGQSCLA